MQFAHACIKSAQLAGADPDRDESGLSHGQIFST